MESKKFMALIDRAKIVGASVSGARAKTVGKFYPRESTDYDFVLQVGSYIHLRSFHSPDNIQHKWKVAEKRFANRYMPRLFRMILEGNKRERF